MTTTYHAPSGHEIQRLAKKGETYITITEKETNHVEHFGVTHQDCCGDEIWASDERTIIDLVEGWATSEAVVHIVFVKE